jgi:hypothetical protein
MRRGMSYIQQKEGWTIGLVTSGVEHIIEEEIEGAIEITVRREIRRRQLLDNFKETRGF